MDWQASGLLIEGRAASIARAGAHVRTDVPRCRPSDRAGDIAPRVGAAGWDVAVAVNDAGVVLGMLDLGRAARDPDATVETLMRPAPVTVRPHVSLVEVVDALRRAGAQQRIVTTSDGRLVGVLLRADAERVLAEAGRRAQAA